MSSSAELVEPDLAQLQGDVRAAESAVQFCDDVLRVAVREVQALDSVFLSAWTRLAGTRERQLDEGIGRVQAARAGLARAKAALDRAQAALAAATHRSSAREHRARSRADRVEERAERLRRSTLPARADLLQLEAEIHLLSKRITGHDEILQVATGLIASAGAVIRRADVAAIDDRHRKGRSHTERLGDELAVREGLVALGDRAQRAAKVARAVGLDGWDWQEPATRHMTVAELADWVIAYRTHVQGQVEALAEERVTMVERRKAVVAARARLVNANDLHR